MNTKNKFIITIAVVLCLSVFGFYKALEIPERLEPIVHSKGAMVYVESPGLSSELLHTEVLRPLEKQLSSLEHMSSIRAEAHLGYGLLSLELEKNAQHNQKWIDKCNQQIDLWRQQNQHSQTYVGRPILITDPSKGYDTILLVPYKNLQKIKSSLNANTQVSDFKVIARPQKQIVIEYNNEDLDQSKMHPMALKDVIEANNTMLPGGTTHEKNRNYSVQSQSHLESIAALKETPVRDPRNNDSVSLGDIVKIQTSSENKYNPEAYLNGERHVVLAIQKESTSNTHEFTTSIEQLATEHNAVIYLDANPTLQSQKNAILWGLIGSVAIVFIAVLFSIGLIPAIGVAASIPLVLSIAASFISLTSVSINMVSLASVILSLSLIIDGHIVVADAVNKKKRSVMDIIKNVGGVLTISMLTTLVSFSPLYFADHVLADYLSSVFIVLLITLTVSLFYCCLVTPFFCSKRIKATKEKAPSFYSSLVEKVIRKKGLVALFALLVLLGGGLATNMLSQSFFPEQKRDYQVLSILSKNPRTNTALKLLTQDIQSELELTKSPSFIGMGAPTLSAYQPFVSDDMRLINIVVPNDFSLEQCDWLRSKYSSYQFELHQASVGPKINYPIAYQILGDAAQIEAFISDLNDSIREHGEIAHIVHNEGRMRSSYKVEIRPDNEGDFTRQDVALALRLNTQGLPLTKIEDKGTLLPVILKAEPNHHNPRESLENAFVFSKNKKVPAVLLQEIAEIKKVSTPAVISTKQGEPVVHISLYPAEGTSSDAAAEKVENIVNDLRKKYSALEITDEGEVATANKAIRAITNRLPLVAFLLVFLLFLKELSIKRVVIILCILPFAFSGATIGLLVSGQSLGFMSLIGIVSLLGIVINNALLWLDALKSHEGHKDRYVQATLDRFRAISITSFTGIATLAMLYFFGGEIWQPLAITLIFGLFFAYLGIIMILPVIAEIIFGKNKRHAS